MVASKPAKDSPTIGTSGSASERVAVVTGSARSFPALTYWIDAGMLANITRILPP